MLQLRYLVVSCVVLAMAAGAPAEMSVDAVSPKLSVGASLRTRWELWNWFEPAGVQNNDYDFIGTQARLSLRWKDDWFEVFAEGQNSALIDLPTTAIAPAPEGNLGVGANYFQSNRRRNDTGVFLKQGYLTLKKLGLPGLSLKGGRFEFAEGSEALTGDATVDWLKNMRISQRLIGPFGWSHIGRAFDGGVLALNREPYNVTLMGARPTQGGFDLNAMRELGDVTLAYAGFNLFAKRASSISDARLFYIYYDDGRHQTKTDNRPLAVRNNAAERAAGVQIHTGGANFIHVIHTDVGSFDVLLWGVLQRGDWGLLDHFAWAYDAEVGWQPKWPGKPWLRGGLTRASGDNNPNDDEHGTFFQLLPTGRLYSFSTFYNMMNSQDAYGSLLLRPIPGLLSRTDFHAVRLTENRDLWYAGSGATITDRNRPEGFGYAGRPANGMRELLTLVETTLSYDWNSSVNTNLYYTHVFGGAVIDRIYRGKQADFGYLEVVLKL